MVFIKPMFEALCIRRTLCRHVTIGTLLVQYCNVARVSCNINETPATLHETRPTLQDCTNSVPIVKNSQTAKMTIGVPIITCLHRVRRIHRAYA